MVVLLWKDKYRIGKNLANHSQQKDTGGTWGYLEFKDCDFEVKFPFAKLRMM